MKRVILFVSVFVFMFSGSSFAAIVDGEASAITVPMLPDELVDLKVKAEVGEKIWVFIQAPSILPNVQFARPSDSYGKEKGYYVALFSVRDKLTQEAQDLYYTASSQVSEIDFGSGNNFSGLGELLITVKKGESPENLETIQSILLLPRSTQQQANVEQLLTDLQSIQSGSTVTQEQKDALAEDLKTLAEGATKPSDESLEKLADDLSEALSDGQVSALEQIKLANDIEAVLNSANIPVEELEAVIGDVQAILVAGGVTQEDVLLIVNDLKAIALEVQNNIPTLPLLPRNASHTAF